MNTRSSYCTPQPYVYSQRLGEQYVEPDIYLWRDSDGHEVDLLVDQGAAQIPIEIKSGQTVAGDFFKNLDYWRRLAGQPDGAAGLVYGGDESYKRRGVSVVSWRDWL